MLILYQCKEKKNRKKKGGGRSSVQNKNKNKNHHRSFDRFVCMCQETKHIRKF